VRVEAVRAGGVLGGACCRSAYSALGLTEPPWVKKKARVKQVTALCDKQVQYHCIVMRSTAILLLLVGVTYCGGQWSAFPANGQNNQAFQFHQYGLDARTVDSATRLAATKVFLANVRLLRPLWFADTLSSLWLLARSNPIRWFECSVPPCYRCLIFMVICLALVISQEDYDKAEGTLLLNIQKWTYIEQYLNTPGATLDMVSILKTLPFSSKKP
jgi:hypothetical protein